MKNSPHRLKHEKQKALRHAQNQDYQTDRKEISEERKKIHISSPKKVKINRARANPLHKHHKTSPKEVTWETEPDSPHREGSHWIRTIKKQTATFASHLRKKLQKINLIKKKK